MSKPHFNLSQQRLDEIQALYREWLALAAKLQAAQKDWQAANRIMQTLNTFYFDGEYRQFCEAVEDGAELDLRTEGEYSVLSEDALWNAFHEQQQYAWQQLRQAVNVLDKDNA